MSERYLNCGGLEKRVDIVVVNVKELIEKVAKVRMVSDRLMAVALAYQGALTLIRGCAPQSGKSVEEHHHSMMN